ncbi:GspH/FimT family pseudopilin [Pseudomonas putida]|uniref:GspH/FimT family pseudopilin n=1 Tax=Pseudomonas putida TaxID=303 RepID=UPI001F524799|nr:GspH/FimT family pseudopilin [Pseudomonas putida]
MKQQGVTLIQMMFGLAMAALLTQLGVPAYAKLSDELHRAAVARNLAQTLRSARGHAALQSQAVVVQPLDNDWGKGWRVLLEHNQQLLREYRPPRPQRVKDNTGSQIRFSALGVPLGKNNNFSGGRLEVCEGSSATSRHHVVLATSGRVSLRTGEAEDSLCAGR